ncbi:hypothetical protein C0214_10855 [Methylobacterium sp. DM1]|nr:hypothetical protein C0214_10855 [Methylobacterium sp. DM1]
MSENPLIGSACWIQPNPGPLAREALDAIGLPSDVTEIRIEMSGDASGNRLSVNGRPVTPADALLVRNAAVCDPVRIGPEPHPSDVRFVRRALTIRRLLNVAEGGEA